MDNLRISRFSSLNFEPYRHHFETNVCYMQKVLQSDFLRVQFLSPENTDIAVLLRSLNTNNAEQISIYDIDSRDGVVLREFVIGGHIPGCYSLELCNVYGEPIAASRYTVITDEEDTILFEYSNYRNDFDVDFTGKTFTFRVEGGFLYKEMNFEAEYESFRSQRYELNHLSAFPHEKHTLTLGLPTGVPAWVAQKVNLIMSLSSTTINGKKYVRGEGAKPEITEIKPYYPLYMYKMELEPDIFYTTNTNTFPNGIRLLGETSKIAMAFNNNVIMIR